MAYRNPSDRSLENNYYTSTQEVLEARSERYRRANQILCGCCAVLILALLGALLTGCKGTVSKDDLAPVVVNAWAGSKLEADRAVVGEPISERLQVFLQENHKWWDQLHQIVQGKNTKE